MPKYATQEWADEYMERLNQNQAYKEAAGPIGFPPNGWEGDFIFVTEPSGPLDHTINMWIGLYHGDCTGCRILRDDEKYQLIKQGEKAPEGVIGVEFIYSATYNNWIKIATKEVDGTKALLSGQAKLQGDMGKVMRAAKAAAELSNTSAAIDTQWY